MTGRLPSHLIVSALLRRANDTGGMGMVRARGDAQAGALLFLVEDPDGTQMFERGIGPDGQPALIESRSGATDGGSVDDYWQRRRARDPDLWVVELNVPQAQRLIVEMLGLN